MCFGGRTGFLHLFLLCLITGLCFTAVQPPFPSQEVHTLSNMQRYTHTRANKDSYTHRCTHKACQHTLKLSASIFSPQNPSNSHLPPPSLPVLFLSSPSCCFSIVLYFSSPYNLVFSHRSLSHFRLLSP
uniref:Secreted protein n=1 Tax=Dicentrarchus labrax TaxID=13489 RepID=A0A8C4FE91_DICLA